MKNKITALSFTFMILVMLSGCASSSGVIPTVTIDGVELTIGESDIYTLQGTDEKFEATGAGGTLAPWGKLDGNSWISESIYFNRDNKRYAAVNLYNPSKEAETVYNCPISKLTVGLEDTDTLVNGIDFSDMDTAGVKKSMENYKLALETDNGTLRYEDGDYKYFFMFDEKSGLVNEITVEILFPKSYTEKLW